MERPSWPILDVFVRPDETTDSLSCTPVSASATTDLIRSITWDDVRTATTSDPEMLGLIDLINNGFSAAPADTPASLRSYHRFRDHLGEYDGVVLYKDRVVIPPALRHRVLEALHAAHQGVSMMDSRAASSFFWPGMSQAISDTRARCNTCNRNAPSQPSALLHHPSCRHILSRASVPITSLKVDTTTWSSSTVTATGPSSKNHPTVRAV